MDQSRAPAEIVTRRILGNFFMNVNKPPFPLRLFTAEAEAIAWLKAPGT